MVAWRSWQVLFAISSALALASASHTLCWVIARINVSCQSIIFMRDITYFSSSQQMDSPECYQTPIFQWQPSKLQLMPVEGKPSFD